MLDGYVINLRSRPDRLAGFQHRMAPFRSQIRINVFPAVDGKDLDLEDIKPRVNPWNFEHLNEDRLRGVLGCALSHLSVWKIIAASEAPLAFVFEDDVAIRDPWLIRDMEHIARTLPRDSELVWLNDYATPGDRSVLRRLTDRLDSLSPSFERLILRVKIISTPNRISFRRWPANSLKTGEAYAISPNLAKRFFELYKDDLGACDEHMRNYTKLTGANAYEMSIPIFKQFDRSDTNIQL